MAAAQPPQDKPHRKRQVIRIYSGQRSPEDLLRALIQAHRGEPSLPD